MFKDNNFIDKIKNSKIGFKTIVYGSVATLILATSTISGLSGNNIFLSLQSSISKILPYDVNVNLSKKLENVNMDGFNVSYMKTSSGKNKYHTMYVSSIDNNKKEIEISEVGKVFDLFTDHIKINYEEKENNLLESLSIMTKLGFNSEINLKMPKEVEKVISVDVENFTSPSITYFDKQGIIHYDTISRHGVLDDAKAVFLTEEQYKKLSDNEKQSVSRVDNKEGLSYNGRLFSRFGGDTQTFVLPKDYKEIISISKDSSDKVISYKSLDGSLKISILNDINLNTEYKLVDSSNKNFYNDNFDKDNKLININLYNKLTDDNNSKAVTLKTNIKKEEVKQILNIDYKDGSFTITYKDNTDTLKTKEVGTTIGVFEGTTVFSGENIKQFNPDKKIDLSRNY